MDHVIKSCPVAEGQRHGIHPDIVLVMRRIFFFISRCPFLRAVEPEVLVGVEGPFGFPGVLSDIELFGLSVADGIVDIDTIAVRMGVHRYWNFVQFII